MARVVVLQATDVAEGQEAGGTEGSFDMSSKSDLLELLASPDLLESSPAFIRLYGMYAALNKAIKRERMRKPLPHENVKGIACRLHVHRSTVYRNLKIKSQKT